MSLNIKDKRIEKKLEELHESGELKKYPKTLLRNSCTVKVNRDDYLSADEFIINSPYCNLPKNIYLYGKGNSYNEDNLYINYWFDIFLKTIENGKIYPAQFKKSNIMYEFTIGIPREFRADAFQHRIWNRENIIHFLSCLFGTTLQEANYQQEDIFELMVA